MNIVKFRSSTYRNCVVSEGFYKAIGLWNTIKAGTIHSVYQMKINPATYKAIESRMKSNWYLKKRTHAMGKDRAQTLIAFDWMNFSPVQDESIPENEIWWEENING